MSGRWQIKHADMRRLADEARRVTDPARVRYTWVPRERNKDADRLANEALDDDAKGRPWRGLAEAPQRLATEPVAAATETVGHEQAELDLDAPPRPGSRPGPAADGAFRPDLGTPTVLLMLRHGATEHTSQQRFAGSGGADLALSEPGPPAGAGRGCGRTRPGRRRRGAQARRCAAPARPPRWWPARSGWACGSTTRGSRCRSAAGRG
ncbi:hypothetical protein GCM10025868_45730 [Angustibacter aerolatus]|uniref:RNase H type-1 domain-containing protein n=1 Tax=Angustibacter aerolatus TaxID=1162965 RepID=A0ABQ6JM47_9ACTN|nr:hypothetical protein GCM10025868_45730 [Angustibacter aerolatus]